MQRLIYSLDSNITDATVSKALGKTFKSSERVCEDWLLLDTHDWALWQAGLSLEQTSSGKALSCCVHHLHTGTLEGVLPAAMPAFVWQLPPSPLRERLAPLWGMRALMPQLRLTRHTTRWQHNNHDGKMLITADAHRFFTSDKTLIGCWLQLQACRGYSDSLPPIRHQLQRKQQWEPCQQSIIDQLLIHASITPAQKTAPIMLHKKMTAALAMKKAMQQQLSIMNAQQQGVMDATDSEFLHRYRIAIRRMRGLLQMARHLMPDGLQQQLTNYFNTLATLTTPARDADVYLLNFATGHGTIPAEELAQLRNFHQWLQQQQRSSYRALYHELSLERYQKTLKLLAEWNPAKESSKAGKQTSSCFVHDAIQKQYHHLLQSCEKVCKKTGKNRPDEALHELRKHAKRLRYALECFASLLPVKRTQAALQQLKTLQNHLGVFQDLCVQQTCLQQFVTTLGDDADSTSCRQSITKITDRMSQQHTSLKKECHHQLQIFTQNSALKKLAEKRGKQ